MENLKFYISQLQGKELHEVLSILKGSTDLSTEEKNFIYLYLFPRPLLDMELPGRIMANRKSQSVGWLEPKLSEIALLVEAYKSEQYKRYIKHLIHSFRDPSKLFPIDGDGQCNCGLCGKNLYEYGAWNTKCLQFPDSPEITRKEYLAFTSESSNISLCKDCLVQLNSLHETLETLEPGYLDWTKGRAPKRSWNDLRL